MVQYKIFNLCFATAFFIVLVASTKREEFHEELFIKPLNDRHVLFQFQFTSLLRFTDKYSDDYTLFPRNIGKIVKSFELQEFHLSLTQGRWLTEKWGNYPLLPSPVGAELSARFSPEAPDTNWERLTQTLAGIFCGSLDEMSGKVATLTCFPQLSAPRGTLSSNSSQTFYGILPREIVCTENLTPWTKLLPCANHAGIASLLDAIELYSAPFHSLGSHVEIIKTETGSILQYVQTVASVIQLPNKNSWNFQDSFGKQQISACSLATLSQIHLLNSDALTWTFPSEFSIAETLHSKTVDLTSKGFSMTATWNSNSIVSQPNLCFAKRFLKTEGHEFGGIKAIISNENSVSARVSYLEILPWYLRTWFHSLKLTLNNTVISMENSEVVKAFEMIPSHFYDSRDLKFRYPNQLELEFELAAFSTLILEFQFDKGFLHFTQHPPDAHRGFDIGSALITCDYSKHSKNSKENSTSVERRYFNKENWVQIYTDPLLVVLPTPDFSMPYNVLTLTGTVFALCFGSVFNLLIRRMKDLERVNGEYVSNRPLARILRKLQQLIQ